MTKVISVLGQKGGIGKTSIITMVANELHSMNYKIILVDVDFQKSLFSKRERELKENQEKIHKTNLYKIISKPLEELTDFIDGVKENDQYDFIFVDMPGKSDGKEVITMLSKVDIGIIPLASGELDVDSQMKFLEIMKHIVTIKRNNNRNISLGVVANKVEKNKEGKYLIETLSTLENNDYYNILKDDDGKVLFLSLYTSFKNYLTTYMPMSALFEKTTHTAVKNNYEKFIGGVIKFIFKK